MTFENKSMFNQIFTLMKSIEDKIRLLDFIFLALIQAEGKI